MTRPPELRLTRTFDAPARIVWEAWSKAEYVAKWFTPAPLTTPKCEIDFRTGGRFFLVMRMPDGVEFPMDATYDEVTPQSRIAFSATIHDGVRVVTVVTFDEGDGKTTMNVHQTYSHESASTRGAPIGWKSTLDQLGEVVRALS